MLFLFVLFLNWNLVQWSQLAESRKIFADEKDAEVKLLERSVEELECTINALEIKVSLDCDEVCMKLPFVVTELH